MNNITIYKIFTLIIATSLLLPNTAYAVVKDNVGGMDTGPAKGTKAITEETVLEEYSGWVNGKKIIGSMSNKTNTVLDTDAAKEDTDADYTDIQIPLSAYYDATSYLKIANETLIKANSNLGDKSLIIQAINDNGGSVASNATQEEIAEAISGLVTTTKESFANNITINSYTASATNFSYTATRDCVFIGSRVQVVGTSGHSEGDHMSSGSYGCWYGRGVYSSMTYGKTSDLKYVSQSSSWYHHAAIGYDFIGNSGFYLKYPGESVYLAAGETYKISVSASGTGAYTTGTLSYTIVAFD